ncbi:MAG: DUF4347 domain-containing protein, partial [Gammaproteobacteria bacterium]
LAVRLLDPGAEGVDQISRILDEYSGLAAVHLVSHGSAGELQLGSGRLDAQTLASARADIAGWGRALAADGDLLLYACDLAGNAEGRALVGELAALTGADVAASDNLTGNALRGGDWVFEYQVGEVTAGVVFGTSLQAQWGGTLATYTVTNLDDAGAGSLREALGLATLSGDIVNFDAGLAGQINLLSALPTISVAIILDGTTALGWSNNNPT